MKVEKARAILVGAHIDPDDVDEGRTTDTEVDGSGALIMRDALVLRAYRVWKFRNKQDDTPNARAILRWMNMEITSATLGQMPGPVKDRCNKAWVDKAHRYGDHDCLVVAYAKHWGIHPRTLRRRVKKHQNEELLREHNRNPSSTIREYRRSGDL